MNTQTKAKTGTQTVGVVSRRKAEIKELKKKLQNARGDIDMMEDKERKRLAANVKEAEANAETKQAILAQRHKILTAAKMPPRRREAEKEAEFQERLNRELQKKKKKIQDLEEWVVDAELDAAAAATHLAAAVLQKADPWGGLYVPKEERRLGRIAQRVEELKRFAKAKERDQLGREATFSEVVRLLTERLRFAKQLRAERARWEAELARSVDVGPSARAADAARERMVNAANKLVFRMEAELLLWKQREGGGGNPHKTGGNTRKYKHHRRLAKRRRRTKRKKRRRRTKRRKRRRRTKRRKRYRRR